MLLFFLFYGSSTKVRFDYTFVQNVHESLATLKNYESLRTQAATTQFILALLAS